MVTGHIIRLRSSGFCSYWRRCGAYVQFASSTGNRAKVSYYPRKADQSFTFQLQNQLDRQTANLICVISLETSTNKDVWDDMYVDIEVVRWGASALSSATAVGRPRIVVPVCLHPMTLKTLKDDVEEDDKSPL